MMSAPKIHIDRLAVRLPYELGPRARAIAPLIAQRLADADWTKSHSAAKVRVPPVSVQTAWSNSAIAGSIARATAAHINARRD